MLALGGRRELPWSPFPTRLPVPECEGECFSITGTTMGWKVGLEGEGSEGNQASIRNDLYDKGKEELHLFAPLKPEVLRVMKAAVLYTLPWE